MWLCRLIVVWWIVWIVSNVILMFVFVISWVIDVQGIVNNIIMMVLVYLCVVVVVVVVVWVFEGFE